MQPPERTAPRPEVEVQEGLMAADLEKLITADQNGREAVAQAQQEALALKGQTDNRVRETQARLQEELVQVRQGAQAEILGEAEARAAEIAAATERQVQELTENLKARHEEVLSLLVSRVLGT
jgi:vacuolar-type H+-ATPase subunit H